MPDRSIPLFLLSSELRHTVSRRSQKEAVAGKAHICGASVAVKAALLWRMCGSSAFEAVVLL